MPRLSPDSLAILWRYFYKIRKNRCINEHMTQCVTVLVWLVVFGFSHSLFADVRENRRVAILLNNSVVIKKMDAVPMADITVSLPGVGKGMASTELKTYVIVDHPSPSPADIYVIDNRSGKPLTDRHKLKKAEAYVTPTPNTQMVSHPLRIETHPGGKLLFVAYKNVETDLTAGNVTNTYYSIFIYSTSNN